MQVALAVPSRTPSKLSRCLKGVRILKLSTPATPGAFIPKRPELKHPNKL